MGSVYPNADPHTCMINTLQLNHLPRSKLDSSNFKTVCFTIFHKPISVHYEHKVPSQSDQAFIFLRYKYFNREALFTSGMTINLNELHVTGCMNVVISE